MDYKDVSRHCAFIEGIIPSPETPQLSPMKNKNMNQGDLVSNCCASDFDPWGYEKEEGIWQERCLKCGKLCESLYLHEDVIRNIKACLEMEEAVPRGGTYHKSSRVAIKYAIELYE